LGPGNDVVRALIAEGWFDYQLTDPLQSGILLSTPGP